MKKKFDWDQRKVVSVNTIDMAKRCIGVKTISGLKNKLDEIEAEFAGKPITVSIWSDGAESMLDIYAHTLESDEAYKHRMQQKRVEIQKQINSHTDMLEYLDKLVA